MIKTVPYRIKAITVQNLRQLLSELDDQYLLEPNGVGNLSIFRGEFPDHLEYIGYVEIGGESVNLLDEDD